MIYELRNANGEPVGRIKASSQEAATASAAATGAAEAVLVSTLSVNSGRADREFRDKVNALRAEIIRQGTTVSVTGHEQAIKLEGRERDLISLLGLFNAAQLRIASGDLETTTDFMDAENFTHALTPPQIMEMWSSGFAYVSSVFARSWVIKETLGPETQITLDNFWTVS